MNTDLHPVEPTEAGSPFTGTGENRPSLAGVLESVPKRLFAVVDGAAYDGLPLAMSAAGLVSRPLYVGPSASEGPHLVPLLSPSDVERLVGTLGDPALAVFWSWPGDEAGLYRHLRSIGMIELPKPGTNPNDPEYDAVTFRHADPRSMAEILPVLTTGQLAALMGEAAGIVYQHRDRLGSDVIVRASRSGQVVADRI